MLDSILLFSFGVATGIVLAVVAEVIFFFIFLDRILTLVTGKKEA